MTAPALELHGISKYFGPVSALENVAFSAQPGRIHALLGENGAGKTTLMRVAFGMIRPDSGWLALNGVRTSLASPAQAIASGVGMVHQQFSLVPAMTVAENVALGGRGRFRREAVARRLDEVGRQTGLYLDPTARVSSLGSAERQKLEIVRTLAHDARILILDEPTAVLTPRDIGELFAQLRLFADGGGSVVLITHKLRDALEHADEVTVLRHGRVVLHSPMSGMTETSLAEAMLGSAPEGGHGKRVAGAAATRVAALDNVIVKDDRTATRSPLDLEVSGGKVLGIAALEGAAAPLLRTLAGRLAPLSGTVSLPAQIGFVPENRQEEGVIPEFDLAENFALRGAGARSGVIQWSDIRERTKNVIRDFDVRANGTESSVSSLSGGNQQRFVLGRELEENPQLLVLENPTQGLDVRAASAIHDRMHRALENGTAIVFYSSDIDELAELSDSVLVVRSTTYAFSGPVRESIGRLLLESDIGLTTNG